MNYRSPLAVVLIVGLLAACGTEPDSTTQDSITVDNCGSEVTIAQPVEKAFLLDSASVPTLHQLGVLDRVMGRAGAFPPDYYDDETQVQLDAIPSLTDRVDGTGHLNISMEEVLVRTPDLVLGSTDTINAHTLAPRGVPLIEEPAYCGAINHPVNWDDVWDQIRLYGEIFDRSEAASEYIDSLKQRVAVAERKVDGNKQPSVAVLYPEVGSPVTFAYGNRSMAHPLTKSAGLRNVFDDVDDRVFEVSTEELLARKPDIVLALYTSGSPEEVSAAAQKALGDVQVIPMLLNYAEPATPLAVDGLERLVEQDLARRG